MQTVETDVNPDGVFDLSAIVISLIVMEILISGIKFSSLFNQIVVAVKLTVIDIVVVGGIGYVSADNLSPFVPPSQGDAGGSGSWLDVPLIETLLYMAVSLILTGMQDYREINPDDPAPVATGFEAQGLDWMSDVISVGACIGLTVVVMILMLGQSRVGFAMARDGLWPTWLAKVHPQFGTPYRITLIIGVAVAMIAGSVELSTLADLVSIGTPFAFVLVSVGVVILRRTRPDLPRAFRTPAAPVVAVLAVVSCVYLMLKLIGETWARFGVWMAIGLIVYFAYGRRHSRLAGREDPARQPTGR